jgi:hypothetical protein
MAGGNPVMQMVIPKIQANIQEHVVLKFAQAVKGTVANDVQQGVALSPEVALAQAAQKVAQTNQKLAELQAQGPDAARNKLADAELMRVANETRKLELDVDNKMMEQAQKQMDAQIKKYAIDMQVIVAELQAQTQVQQNQFKEMMSVMTKVFDNASKSTMQTKQLSFNEKQASKKEKKPKSE